MNAADIEGLDARLARLHRMCGRRAPSESEVKFWFDELAGFPADDVFDVLSRWERESDAEHPPTLKLVKRMVVVKFEAHRRRREFESRAAWQPPGPNARAFARMWQALRERRAADPRAWCEAVLADPRSAVADMEFARAALARMGDASRLPPVGAPAAFVAAGAVVMPRAENEAEREARLEREAIQAEGCAP